MGHTTRRLLTGVLLVLAAGAGTVIAPGAAHAAGVRATIDVNSKLKVRAKPSLTAKVAGTLRDGQRINVTCSITGQSVRGKVRTTTLWDRLADGRYVSHAYVRTSGKIPVCKSAAPAPAPKPTPAPALTPAQFIAAAVPGAQQGWREYGVPASVTIAQAILESGWGRSGLSSVDRNYFGIKCQGGSYGPHATGCHVYRTTECDKAGKCFETSDAFRTYASMARSFRDHGHFLKNNKRYAPAFAHTKNANKFIEAVRKAGYATDPNYTAKVTNIMKKHDLYQYDTWK
ncbi:sporangiospore maturation cell wall hydrolase GsmA [Actinoplanes hulinensis]|uniref:Sporangiospore maturation cell wall hydrolase GsmA n=1 Tax=Actinoplanes hulinensis TaxID=1144547 RepID=A0ABS7B3K7_9ACTN|nr:sporangiospore maturation cell wall hydrolase GsmA [Actinoplanes hulinensis]MBW6435573.1 sporangiospore maturation cell wall hydrolase GsmA [Actinoplanes hulinensis]